MDSNYSNLRVNLLSICLATVVLNHYTNQCPVLFSQRNRMKLVLERPWADG